MQLIGDEHGDLRVALHLLQRSVDERHLVLDDLNARHESAETQLVTYLSELSLGAAVSVEDDLLRKHAAVGFELN